MFGSSGKLDFVFYWIFMFLLLCGLDFHLSGVIFKLDSYLV